MDIYFTKEYGKLCELIEHGTCEIFQMENELGKVSHMFIKREIKELVDGKKFYDLTTPYGYGGPRMEVIDSEKKEQLSRIFEKEFGEYCKNNNIVSEFIRFYPLGDNAIDFKSVYSSEYNRNTLGTNLKDYEDPVKEEFSKGCRKSIRQALRKGISCRITEGPNNIDAFIDIYYSTMKRDSADEFYYFGKDYFDMLINALKENVLFVEAIYEEKTIAAGLYLISDGIIHTHLSGTLSEYLYLSPAYILRYAATLWGKEHGYCLVHHGGGTSSDKENSLFKFKKQFAKNTEFPFYIGKKIWNDDVYRKLCNMNPNCKDSVFFPKYRAK